MFKGPQINKLGGNLGGRDNNTDKTFALIAGGVAVLNKYALGDIIELLQPSDADAYGLTSAYDSANKVLVRYHIDEFFNYCPDGTLFVMLVPQGTTMASMCDVTGVNIGPVGHGALKAMMIAEATRREIKKVGVVLNPGYGTPPTPEVVAYGTVQITDKGANTDVVFITVDEGNGFPLLLAEVTIANSIGVNAIAAALQFDLIQRNSLGEHGYTATVLTDTVKILAPAGRGVGANAYTLGFESTGTTAVTATLVQFAHGVDEIAGTGYTPTLSHGLDIDVLNAIPYAQATVDFLKTQYIYLDNVMVEGRHVNGTIANMKDLRTLAAPNVSVVIAADPAIQALDPYYQKYAAVGTALGGLAIRKVSECLGSVGVVNPPDAKKGYEYFSISNPGYGKWLTAALSSGQKFATLSQNDQVSLTDKGYIYAGSFADYPGIYFNDSPTCIAVSDDYAYIERNAVWNKAARYLRQALIPKVRSKYKKDAATGYATPATIANWEQAARKKLELMVTDDEVSAVGVYIDPAQAPSADVPLKLKVGLVIDGILREITVDLSLANSL